jgi:hypothetical protein
LPKHAVAVAADVAAADATNPAATRPARLWSAAHVSPHPAAHPAIAAEVATAERMPGAVAVIVVVAIDFEV